jgi:hypothetical protein
VFVYIYSAQDSAGGTCKVCIQLTMFVDNCTLFAGNVLQQYVRRMTFFNGQLSDSIFDLYRRAYV